MPFLFFCGMEQTNVTDGIDDAMWDKLNKLLPKPKGRHGKDDRLFLEAVCWIIRTGAPWRDLPLAYGKWKSVYNRYHRWVKQEHFNRIFERLKKRWRSRMAYD